jgi:hypothetical protein
MIIKFIHHNGKKRQAKVATTPNFDELRKLSVKIWGETVANCLFGYIDCDEELITIVNQDDWEVCIEEMESLQVDKRVGKITVRVLENDEINSMTESVVIKDAPTLETEVSIAPTETVEVSHLEESTFTEFPEDLIKKVTETETEETEVEKPLTEAIKVSLPAQIVNNAIQRSVDAINQAVE